MIALQLSDDSGETINRPTQRSAGYLAMDDELLMPAMRNFSFIVYLLFMKSIHCIHQSL